MTYETHYDPSKDEHLKPHFEEILDLEVGERLTLRAKPDLLPSIRYRIYNWLYHTGLKPHFRIQTEPSALIVRRMGGKPYITTTREDPSGSPPLDDSVIRSMIQSPSPQEALRLAIDSGQVPPEQAQAYLDRLDQILGPRDLLGPQDPWGPWDPRGPWAGAPPKDNT